MKKITNEGNSIKELRKVLRIMKLCFLFLIFGISSVFASNTYGQTTFTMNLNNKTLKDVIFEIEENSNYIFFYNDEAVDLNRVVSVSARKKSVESILDESLKGSETKYRISDRQIILYSASDPTQGAGIVQQSLTITGRVIDNNGDPLPGVNILVKGTNDGVTTNVEGFYSIKVPYANASLVLSYIGFQPVEIELQGRKNVDVTMIEDTKALEEVVVVGYTTQKKATITGAVSTITTKDLKQSPTANLNNALAGRMPGLMVNQFAGGEPGVDRSDIYIRGMGTYGDKSPIVIVDGVERSMSYLAPEEIETFTILKDASATAAYGIRGANGVIIVTTKRGKAQEKATVSFKASVGVNEPVKFPEYLGSADYAMLHNEAVRNDNPGIDPSKLNLFSTQAIDNFRKAKGDNSDGLGYDWDYFDYAFKPGLQQDYSLSIRGGSDRARYYVMANYFQQDGNYEHTNLSAYNTQAIFKRYNFRSNIDIDITKKFYARLDLGARITDRNAPGTTASRIVSFCNTQPPYLPIVVENNENPGNATNVVNNPLGMLFGDQIYRFNILGELSRTGFLNEKNTYLDGSFMLGYDLDFITKGLKVEGVFSYDASNGRWINRKVNTYTEGYREYPGYATFQPSEGRDVYMEPGHYAGVYKTGNKYNIDQTIANDFSRNDDVSRTYYQLKLNYDQKFGSHAVTALLLFNRSEKVVNNNIPFCYQGLTGMVTYNYDSRYLLDLNVGYNGSENFAPGKRYGLFPAFSAGWIISNEKFMEGTRDWLDNFKIRGSFGIVGSDKMPNDKRFGYLQYFTKGSDYYLGINDFNSKISDGLKEGDLANPNISWEKARKTDIGIDLAFFGQKLTVVADVFFEHRYDIITDLGGGDKLGFPDIVGKDAPYINSGIVDNKGIDFEVGWNGKIGRDIRYFIKPNFTFARNNIKFMNEIPREFAWRANTGKRIDEHFVYVFDHFVRDQAEASKLNAMNDGSGYQQWGTLIPGDVVYKDLNGDGKIDDLGDRTSMGFPRSPEIQFGIPFGIQYKGFDFSMLFQGAANASLLLTGPAVWDFPLYDNDKYGRVKKMHLERWTPETAETAKYPALHIGDHSNNKNNNSSLFLYDAKYIRLKNIEFGYTLPRSALRFAGFQQVRFYLQGMNLATWDGLKDVDVDPETKKGQGDWYPIQKVVNFGVDITF